MELCQYFNNVSLKKPLWVSGKKGGQGKRKCLPYFDSEEKIGVGSGNTQRVKNNFLLQLREKVGKKNFLGRPQNARQAKEVPNNQSLQFSQIMTSLLRAKRGQQTCSSDV